MEYQPPDFQHYADHIEKSITVIPDGIAKFLAKQEYITQLTLSWVKDVQVFLSLYFDPLGVTKVLLYVDPTYQLLWVCDRYQVGAWVGGMGGEISSSTTRPRNFLYQLVDLETLGYVDSAGDGAYEPFVAERYPEFKLKLNASGSNWDFASIAALYYQLKDYYVESFNFENPGYIISGEAYQLNEEEFITQEEQSQIIIPVIELLIGEYMRLGFQNKLKENTVYKYFEGNSYQYRYIKDGARLAVNLNNYDGGNHVNLNQINIGTPFVGDIDKGLTGVWPSGFFDTQYMFNVGHYVPTFLIIDRNLTTHVARQFGLGLLICRLSDEAIDAKYKRGLFAPDPTCMNNIFLLPDLLAFGRTDYLPVDIDQSREIIVDVCDLILSKLSDLEISFNHFWIVNLERSGYELFRNRTVNSSFKPDKMINFSSDIMEIANNNNFWIASSAFRWTLADTLAITAYLGFEIFGYWMRSPKPRFHYGINY